MYIIYYLVTLRTSQAPYSLHFILPGSCYFISISIFLGRYASILSSKKETKLLHESPIQFN